MNAVISKSRDILGGTPVFAGTRVPVQKLMDHLEGGESIDDFLKGFPSVTREQVIAFLKQAQEQMLASLSESGSIDLAARGITPEQAADLRARLKPFAEDWERPEMDVYDAV